MGEETSALNHVSTAGITSQKHWPQVPCPMTKQPAHGCRCCLGPGNRWVNHPLSREERRLGSATHLFNWDCVPADLCVCVCVHVQKNWVNPTHEVVVVSPVSQSSGNPPHPAMTSFLLSWCAEDQELGSARRITGGAECGPSPSGDDNWVSCWLLIVFVLAVDWYYGSCCILA